MIVHIRATMHLSLGYIYWRKVFQKNITKVSEIQFSMEFFLLFVDIRRLKYIARLHAVLQSAVEE